MKKQISIAIVGLVLFMSIPFAHAQQDQQDQYQSLLQQIITLLTQEVGQLESQLVIMQQQQDLQQQTLQAVQSSTQQLSQNLGVQNQQIEQQTMPEIIPAISMTAELQDNQKVYQVKVIYAENGTPISGMPVTLTADDQGTVRNNVSTEFRDGADNVEFTNSKVSVFNDSNFTIGASFFYVPIDPGLRTLTATANGVSSTLQIQFIQNQ